MRPLFAPPLRATHGGTRYYFTVSTSPFPVLINQPPLDHERFAAHRELEALLKASLRGEVRFDLGSRALYAADSSNYRQLPVGVVLPRDAADVEAALAACRATGAAILPRGGSELVTVISLCTVLSLINATLLGAPRILYAIGRDGMFSGKATRVSASGTPSVALGITSVAVALLILSGTLEQLIAVAAVLFVLNYVSAYSAVIVLRIRQPAAERPFRALGYPWTTGLVLLGSVIFLVAAVVDDPRSGTFAAILIAISIPASWWISRLRPAPVAP